MVKLLRFLFVTVFYFLFYFFFRLKPFLGVDSVHLVSSCQVEQVTTWATEKVESHQHEVSEVSKRLGATGR